MPTISPRPTWSETGPTPGASRPDDLEDLRPVLGRDDRPRWELQVHRRTDHELDDVVDVQVHAVVRALNDPVAQHREPVGQSTDLFEPVADVDDGASTVADATDQRLQSLGSRNIEDRGRLIQQQHLGLVHHRANHLEHLSPAGAKLANVVALTEGEVEVSSSARRSLGASSPRQWKLARGSPRP